MDTSAATQATELALQVIAPIVIALGAWIAHRLVRLLEEKTGIDIPDKQEDKIEYWIEQGINLAVEKSHQKLKAHTEKLKGPEKLEEAADYVFALATARGWTDWTKDKIKNKIEASLGADRVDN